MIIRDGKVHGNPPTTPAHRGPGRPATGGPGSRGGKTKQKAVRLTNEQITWLEQRATQQGGTVSGLIYDAVAAWIAVAEGCDREQPTHSTR
jgi:hypothetical protein